MLLPTVTNCNSKALNHFCVFKAFELKGVFPYQKAPRKGSWVPFKRYSALFLAKSLKDIILILIGFPMKIFAGF